MRLRVLSDLHLEFAPLHPAPAPADVVVLAGDIHQGVEGLEWARRVFGALPIVYVPGNHEYYGHDWERLPQELAAAATRLGIHLLDCGTLILDGVRFLGCTLWTDFDLFGAARRGESMAACARTLFDYRHIRSGPDIIDPEMTRQRHLRERAWLEAALVQAPGGAWRSTVVVTHMVPSLLSTAQRYQDQLLSAGFVTHLDDLVRRADVWIHGHTHDSYRYRLGGCELVCNPRGYPRRRPGFENSGFDERLVVPLAAPGPAGAPTCDGS